MRRAAIYRIQRLFAIIGFVAFVGIVLIVARIANVDFSWEQLPITQGVALPLPIPAPKEQIALISGHAGFDSGAICADDEGNTTLTEAEISADIADRAAKLLRSAGMDVSILEEYDPRINNLQVDALLSLHADSCIDASGYKAAYYLYSTIPAEDSRLVDCIDLYYPAATGLTQHANTITHNMTEYHAFRKVGPTTPAAILELGFLGGDQELLTAQTDRAARGVADSIRCFVNPLDPTPEPPPTATQSS